MIKISKKQNSKIIEILAEGHAGYAKRGQDIVCAGVSALMDALGDALIEHSERSEVTETDGRSFLVVKEPTDTDRLIVDVFMAGLEAIARSYPEYVRVEAV